MQKRIVDAASLHTIEKKKGNIYIYQQYNNTICEKRIQK